MYSRWWLDVDFPSHRRLIPWPYRWVTCSCRNYCHACDIRLHCSAPTEAPNALLKKKTLYGSRQANGNQVTWTSCNHIEVLRPQATGRRAQAQRLTASSIVHTLAFFFKSSFLSITLFVFVIHTSKGCQLNCHHKNPTRTHPSHPRLVLISEPTREETAQHTPFLPDVRPLSAADVHIDANIHTRRCRGFTMNASATTQGDREGC